jgi:hypothetical protein
LAKQTALWCPGWGKAARVASQRNSIAPELNRPKTSKEIAQNAHPGAVVVDKVIPALVSIPKSSGMARSAGGGTNVRSSQGMD